MARAKVTRTSYKQDSRIVQALAYGDLGNITESFFDETVRATSEHRFVVLALCGLVGDAAFANSTIIPFESTITTPAGMYLMSAFDVRWKFFLR